jgi:hypothetical protein
MKDKSSKNSRWQAQAAAKVDPKLHQKQAPPGYALRGTSTLLDAEGNVTCQWVKTTREAQALEGMLEAFSDAITAAGIPRAKRTPAPRAKTLLPQLLSVYPWGDPHLGMLSWPAETGHDFNLKIATAQLYAAVDKLVDLAPASEEALIINLGDFFHSDNQENPTARTGHALDVDSRWSKILEAGTGVAIRCVKRALEKHKKVTVDTRIGNHDDHSSVFLALLLRSHFHAEPRVEINVSPSQFYYKRFGQCLIGATHGHNTRPDKLPGIMATDVPAEWGATQFRYWYTGHVHHESRKEFPGCSVETFRTLAARDAWHHSKGYRAGRSMVCDVLHKTRGRLLRHEIGVESLD